MTTQSQVFPIFIRGEYQQGQGFARFESDAQRSADRVRQEFRAIGNVIDEALIRDRSAAGSLDLGLDELRQAAQAQQQRAIAAREVADATLRAAQVDGTFNAEMREGVAAARQYATAQENLAGSLRSQLSLQEAIQRELDQTASATDALTAAQLRGNGARSALARSVGAERTAFVQLGQQMQDVTVQAQLGTNAFTIFTQQVPQAAFALSALANSADATKARIGSFATFLAGPWGAAVFAATAVLGPYVASLFESGDAADESSNAHATLADRLDAVRFGYEAAVAAAREYNAETAKAAQTALQLAQRASQAANALLDQAKAKREAIRAELSELAAKATDPNLTPTGRSDAARNAARASGLLRQQEAEIAVLEQASVNTTFDLVTEQARIQSDAAAAIAESYAYEREQLRGRVTDTNELRRALIELNAEEKAALDALQKRRSSAGGNSSAGSDRAAIREAQRLAELASEAAREIEQIGRGFDSIPSGVARVQRSVTELDDLIAELQQREPPDFEQLVEQAKTVRAELQDSGLQRLLTQELGELAQANAQIFDQQRLILTGRRDEAEVLGIMADLQREYGAEAANYRDLVEQIVDARSREEFALERIGERLEAYRSATQGIRGELESLFAGEGFDPQRVFRQLQSRLQVEAIFGDALRQIDAAVDESFEQAVDDLTGESRQLEQSFRELITEVERTAIRFAGVDPSNPILRTSPGFGAEFDAAFGTRGNTILSGANDNDKSIIVEGLKASKDGIAGMRPEDYAILIGEKLTEPILLNLPEGIAKALSPVLSRAAGGYLTGGPVGGILGAFDGLFGSGTKLGGKLGVGAFGVEDIFGKLFDGAGRGQAVSGLLDALGIGNSTTGAQIGGAIGNVFGPIGSIVGSIAGSLIGGLLSGTARGSAIIGGQGGSLGITGFYGGNNEREAAAANLGRTAIETVERLAAELGATVNAGAGRVSIGIREDSINVDPQGRGYTNTSRFSDIRAFGDDAEAAVLFAVQNLIQDGVIAGLSAAEQRLVQQGDDIEQAISDVLTFRSVFDRLEGLQNPLRAEIRALNSEFEDLIDLFERAGASAEEFASLEQLYDLERAKLIEEATDRIAGSLKSLIDDLTTGDNGLSLRSRRASALGEFEDLRARVEAGDVSAFDDFEDAARTLLDIERQIFGSQEDYFARLDEVLAISRAAVAEQEALVAAGSGLSDPFGVSSGTGAGINPIGIPIAEQTAELGARLDAINNNLGTLIAQGAARGTGGQGGRLIAQSLAY